MNRVQEKITAIKHRQALNTDTQTLKPDIRAPSRASSAGARQTMIFTVISSNR